MTILLSQLLEQDPRETLWIADENSKALLQQGFMFSGALVSNRWDIFQMAKDKVGQAFFSDFRLDQLPRQYRRIVYTVSKEKAATHHVINQAAHSLLALGELVMTGQKNSGIKTYAGKAAAYFGSEKQLLKDGTDYLSIHTLPEGGPLGAPLEDTDYPQLRQPQTLGGLYSKPGQFGWNKIDTGSALLAAQFANYLPQGAAQIVDLGCGYGYLSAQMARRGNFTFTATDNNAAALLACAKNFAALEIRGDVVPSDAGTELPAGIADCVICNPPFHQGFQVEGDLTGRFLQQGARLLKRGGQALYVVNEFIPLPRKAQAYFASAELIAKDKGFCCYRLLL